MNNKTQLVILATGRVDEVCTGLETLVKTFGRNATLAEVAYQVKLTRLNAVVRKQLNNQDIK